MNTEVILVDTDDRQLGTMEKMEVHRKGLLHRAFSVFIFNSKGELLMQQRANEKYHSAGLWTNTCCSHPLPDEHTDKAAERRLKEEMGMNCELKKAFQFIYNIELENNLIEHELDHVYIGYADSQPKPDPIEVQDWKYINMEKLATELHSNPQNYTVWLRHCFEKVYAYHNTNKKKD